MTGSPPRPEPVAQVLLQLPQLRVGQGVHRVDHDRADPTAPAGAGCLTFLQDAVHDRDDVRQGLTGTGAGGQDVGVVHLCGLDRLPLMEVEGQRTAVRAPRVLLLARLEDLRTPGVQHAVPHEVGDLATVGEEGIERQPRVGPLRLRRQVVLDEAFDPGVPDHRRTLGEVLVLLDQIGVDAEDVHRLGQARLPARHGRGRGRCALGKQGTQPRHRVHHPPVRGQQGSGVVRRERERDQGGVPVACLQCQRSGAL